MSEMISRRSDCLRIHAHSEVSPGRGAEFLLAVPRALFRAARRAWKTHADEKLLRELSDHQLRDIGIRREHIPHVVRGEWDI